MNAYLLSGWVTDSRMGCSVDSCSSLILVGLEQEAARKHYEEWLLIGSDGEPVSSRKIQKVACAPVVDEVLTEGGPAPLDWDLIGREVMQALEGAAPDQSERGYWVDCDQYLGSERLPGTVESLRGELPEEISSELNWEPDRNYVFIVQALRLLEQKSELAEDDEGRRPDSGVRTEEDSAALEKENDNTKATQPPDWRDIELVSVARARNAVMAGWLWKRQAQSTKLARHEIKVSQWIETLIRDSEGVFRVAGEEPAPL